MPDAKSTGDQLGTSCRRPRLRGRVQFAYSPTGLATRGDVHRRSREYMDSDRVPRAGRRHEVQARLELRHGGDQHLRGRHPALRPEARPARPRSSPTTSNVRPRPATSPRTTTSSDRWRRPVLPGSTVSAESPRPGPPPTPTAPPPRVTCGTRWTSGVPGSRGRTHPIGLAEDPDRPHRPPATHQSTYTYNTDQPHTWPRRHQTGVPPRPRQRTSTTTPAAIRQCAAGRIRP